MHLEWILDQPFRAWPGLSERGRAPLADIQRVSRRRRLLRANQEAMKLAFFEMRAERLIAKVHPDNARSLKVFQRAGFLIESQTTALRRFAMTLERYRRLLRESPAGHADHIHITETDQARLRNLIALDPASASFELEHEIERAIVVDSRQMPRDVVTMNSRALLHLDDDVVEVALVYPDDADDSAGRLSVCAGIGTAILGYREGDDIHSL